MPAASGADVVTAPLEFTLMVGEPVLWVNVTDPWAPVVPIEPLNEVLVFVDPLVPVTVMVPPPVLVSEKLTEPVPAAAETL